MVELRKNRLAGSLVDFQDVSDLFFPNRREGCGDIHRFFLIIVELRVVSDQCT